MPRPNRPWPCFALAAAQLFATTVSAAEPREIFSLADPRGDDRGAGELVYPLRDDLRPGDLDLIRLTARPDPDGTLFEATFAKPIAKPGPRTIDIGGGSLLDIARHGFYTFNIDIYVDTDRVPGSGAVSTLPGRKAEIDPSSAWEKAVCLTPRPNEARDALKTILTRYARQDLKAEGQKADSARMKTLGREIRTDIENRVFFPTRVHVFGTTVRFLVPTAFLGGPAKPSWSYVVAVSGAEIVQRLDVAGSLGLAKDAPDSLMILPVAPGTWSDRFGGGEDDDPLEPPLVDIVVPRGKSQKGVLEDRDPASKRPVRLPGVVPADERAVASGGS
jgi:C-terminal binding-module, SLH-like, of glucodextranase